MWEGWGSRTGSLDVLIWEVREMRSAETVLSIIQDRGKRGLPIEQLYRQLYNRELYLLAYSRIYSNNGAMTRGTTLETADRMSIKKIDTIIESLRYERYRWNPVRRTYINKKNGQKRPLSIPCWSDKLLQEVIRLLLEAYYDPQFSPLSHGYRPGKGCHTALHEIGRKWKGIKWFIEGDIRDCYGSISHKLLLSIMKEKICDNRFIHLISNLLRAGYLEGQWRYTETYSGVPQGSGVSPILSNIVLDRLDKFVKQKLVPENSRGKCRKTYPPYVVLTKAAWKARKNGNRKQAEHFNQLAQQMPSRDPNDPNFRRLHFCRYCDDFLLGYIGTKAEAKRIKDKLAQFLSSELELELSQDKTLITNARNDYAKFLGYNVHTLHANDKHDHRGQRCINGAIGMKVPVEAIHNKSKKYMKRGKPIHLMQRTNDSTYSIVAQYQVEWRGVVQYYKLAYNLCSLYKLKRVMETSLTKTLAKKHKTTRRRIYRRYKKTITNEHGTYKVLQMVVNRDNKKPLIAQFGGVPLKWNKWAKVNDTPTQPIYSGRSELLQRLLREQCEICDSTQNIEVHHIRKLADLKGRNGQLKKSKGAEIMAKRRRKTLIVCQKCHNDIHYGKYDGEKISK